MNKNIAIVYVCFVVLIFNVAAGQERRDTGAFIDYEDEFKDQLKKQTGKEDEITGVTKKFKMDFMGISLPESIEQFKQAWHQDVISQDLTGTCWSFSATSFFESEVQRLTGQKVKLPEMYAVYWEYVEKARRFVQHRGDSVFSKGAQPDGVRHIYKQYGIVPADAYRGIASSQTILDDSKMFDEMDKYLESVKSSNAWNEDIVIGTIRSILDSYMGRPPERVLIDNRQMTPLEYLKETLKLDMDDYVDVMSLMEKPSYQQAEYKVADNWRCSAEYYNLPLDDFMNIIKTAVRNGCTVCIAGDTSEAGLMPRLDVAMIPTFDIPSSYIDQYARQLRFSNESTTDDHAIHLVGYLEKDGHDWYLIKDSGTPARHGKNKGYFFYHDDFVKLKMMNFMVHKDILKQVVGEKITIK